MPVMLSRGQIAYDPTQLACQGLQQEEFDSGVAPGARMAEHQKTESPAGWRSQRRNHRVAKTAAATGVIPGDRGSRIGHRFKAPARKVTRQLAQSRLRQAYLDEVMFAYPECTKTKIDSKKAPQPRQEMSEQEFFVVDPMAPEIRANEVGTLPQAEK
jgi:hypothetical protein